MDEEMPAYEKDLGPLSVFISGLHHDTVVSVDWLRDSMQRKPRRNDYAQLHKAFKVVLRTNACQVGRSAMHGLAYVEHDVGSLNRLIPLFEEVARDVTGFTGKGFDSDFAARVVQQTCQDFEAAQAWFAEFQERYGEEIERDKATDGYAQDRRVISKSVAEISRAVLEGVSFLQRMDIGAGRSVLTLKSASLNGVARQKTAKRGVWSPYLRILGCGS